MNINEINEFQAFAILGLKPTASEQEFRARFKELAQNADAEDFQRITIAKEILDIYFHETL